MKRPLLIAAALCALSPIVACSQSSVDTSDRAAIEQIVREFIMENPDVIEAAFEQRAADERKQEIESIASAAAENLDELLLADGDFYVGREDAPITVVEFLDYRCGNCKDTAEWAIELPNKFDGDVRVIFKEYPILSPQSEVAALAALAAGQQGKYVEMHRGLMALDNSSGFTDASIDEVAVEAGVDLDQMRADMASSEVQFVLAKAKSLGRKIGINGTPNYLIKANGLDKIDVIPGAAPAAIEGLIKDTLEDIS